MLDFDYDPYWPSPSSRHRSFEVEAFPVAAYRFDVRRPNEVARKGVHNVGEYGRFVTTPKLFGSNTVFASATKNGVENYIINDTVRFLSTNSEIKRRIFSDRESIFNDEGIIGNFNKPYLYKIKKLTLIVQYL
ncbi:hypothetical protein HED55_08565 [Ochrobactrum haematophilum]|uniref:Uncharacterized protein n=1 Tax=Brucella haematophila TaxID=419474 RepID=A0ABX1DMV8_9HYPH|nr:hypothetical protein [Brucella haematophila]